MDLKRVIAAVPLLRRLWRVLPGPLRLPLLAIAFVVWLKRRGRDGDPDGGGTTGDQTGTA